MSSIHYESRTVVRFQEPFSGANKSPRRPR
jgi:hypothetical protein